MASRVVVTLLPLACLVYGAVALGTRGAWLAAAAGVLTAWLLGRRHARARFAAYIFFSAVAVRSALTGRWPTLAFPSPRCSSCKRLRRSPRGHACGPAAAPAAMIECAGHEVSLSRL